jgi:uncharacterized protein (TIGR00661 family)
MRILYAIQGTGNGHLTRSISVIKELQNKASVDILLSGTHYEIKPPTKILYDLKGLGFIFGQNGSVDFAKTFKQLKLRRFYSEIRNIPINNYSFVVNDFEPVSVRAAKRAGIPTIGLSNQASVFHPKINKPPNLFSLSKLIMKYYARCDYNIGLHFERVDEYIETPIIRNEIRYGIKSDKGTGVVYIPFYSDEIIYSLLKNIPELDWIVFSKHSTYAYRRENVKFEPINAQLFTENLLSCHLVLTAAGFGTTSEALFLEKKMVVVPMQGQYEQTFNAHALKALEVTILNSFFNKKAESLIRKALTSDTTTTINFPDNIKTISDKVFELYNQAISR